MSSGGYFCLPAVRALSSFDVNGTKEWALAIVLAFLMGMLLVWTLVLRKQSKNLKALKERVLDGGEKIPLLTDEALELISVFKKKLEDTSSQLTTDLDAYRSRVESQLRKAQEIANQAQDLTTKTVSQFKENLRKSFGQIQAYMQKIADSSAGAYEQTKQTAEYSKQVGETLVSKNQELAALREGYQLSMLGPLVKGSLGVMDQITSLMAVDTSSAESLEDLKELKNLIVRSLEDLGVSEINLHSGDDPTKIDSYKWEPLDASRATNDQSLDKMVAEVIKPGFVAMGPDGSEAVIRKTLVVRYRYQSDVEIGE